MTKVLSKKRRQQAMRIQGLMRDDQAVRLMVVNTMNTYRARTIGDLGRDHPKVFDEMIECVDDLLSQAPPEEKFGWMG